MRPILYSATLPRVSSAVGRADSASRSAVRLLRQRLAPTGAGRVRHGPRGRLEDAEHLHDSPSRPASMADRAYERREACGHQQRWYAI